jgi:hypothetical protein
MGSIGRDYAPSRLSLEESIRLLSGQDFWRTSPNKALGLGSLKFSDGPNGVRGEDWINGAPSAAIPCAIALGASFDVELASQLANLLARECKRKGVHGLLAPTMNIHRYPLCKSYDKVLNDPQLIHQADGTSSPSARTLCSVGWLPLPLLKVYKPTASPLARSTFSPTRQRTDGDGVTVSLTSEH